MPPYALAEAKSEGDTLKPNLISFCLEMLRRYRFCAIYEIKLQALSIN